ncbi:hypothetical protein ANN_00267 [Periplaneta americana]|uniref:CHK kinase-like domain-containing protein n=1 Tax=Periplaneta americana TaxID=6978 RepID=A0ABQ8TSP4_PERAM|nr:hypothetical protein ANN_00267 [Periplaneta americana]
MLALNIPSSLSIATAMDQAAWITDKLVPIIVQHGSFNNRNKGRTDIISCEVTPKKNEDHYMSNAFFINVLLKFEADSPERYYMMIKRPQEDPYIRQFLNTEVLFHNETLIYTQMIPLMEEFLKKRVSFSIQSIFPTCYYARSDSAPDEDVVVLGDLKPEGFRTTEMKVFLDYDHCVLALRALGRLHAVSYGMKNLEGSAFRTIISKLRVQTFANSSESDIDLFFKKTTLRAVKYFARGKGVDQTVVKKLKDKFSKCSELLVQLLTPKEPLTVMCHGDFCRNNMMFRYDECGKPCEVKFFDLQVVTYASPAIDVSFFAYLNMSSELREQHWDDLFKEYHTSVVNNLADILRCPVDDLMQNFSLKKFQKDFSDHAVYGFLHSSFFLPFIMTNAKKQVKWEEIFSGGLVEIADTSVELGGEEATVKLADILKDLVNRSAI